MATMKGTYQCKNPQKYIGDPTKIRIMSSWELRVFLWMDENPSVIKWSSEPVSIPYLKPTDKKIHKYYPDIYAEIKDQEGNIKKYMLEIKPSKEAVLKPKSNAYDKLSIMINQAKWFAANQVCLKNGIIFKVLTEQDLFLKK